MLQQKRAPDTLKVGGQEYPELGAEFGVLYQRRAGSLIRGVLEDEILWFRWRELTPDPWAKRGGVAAS